MAEAFFVACECGERLRVELFEAGTRKTCPSCNASLTVPNSVKLLKDSGDPYPLLRPVEKIQRAVENAAAPFDGLCHACSECRADWRVPITLKAMVERQVSHDGGIRPTLTGGLSFVVAPAEERWQSTTFPLFLCSRCHERFRLSRSRANSWNVVRILGLVILLGAFLLFAVYNLELVAALGGVFWLIGLFAWAARFRRNKKFPRYLKTWLDRIRWVPEAIAAEDEFRVSAGRSRAIKTL